MFHPRYFSQSYIPPSRAYVSRFFFKHFLSGVFPSLQCRSLRDTPTIGQHSGKSKKLSGNIDIITARTISHTDSSTQLLADHGYLIIDECHSVPLRRP